jgi:hypothetical protein
LIFSFLDFSGEDGVGDDVAILPLSFINSRDELSSVDGALSSDSTRSIVGPITAAAAAAVSEVALITLVGAVIAFSSLGMLLLIVSAGASTVSGESWSAATGEAILLACLAVTVTDVGFLLLPLPNFFLAFLNRTAGEPDFHGVTADCFTMDTNGDDAEETAELSSDEDDGLMTGCGVDFSMGTDSADGAVLILLSGLTTEDCTSDIDVVLILSTNMPGGTKL